MIESTGNGTKNYASLRQSLQDMSQDVIVTTAVAVLLTLQPPLGVECVKRVNVDVVVCRRFTFSECAECTLVHTDFTETPSSFPLFPLIPPPSSPPPLLALPFCSFSPLLILPPLLLCSCPPFACAPPRSISLFACAPPLLVLPFCLRSPFVCASPPRTCSRPRTLYPTAHTLLLLPSPGTCPLLAILSTASLLVSLVTITPSDSASTITAFCLTTPLFALSPFPPLIPVLCQQRRGVIRRPYFPFPILLIPAKTGRPISPGKRSKNYRLYTCVIMLPPFVRGSNSGVR
jgi:hypothetical protein